MVVMIMFRGAFWGERMEGDGAHACVFWEEHCCMLHSVVTTCEDLGMWRCDDS